ncbi:MAG: NAD(P)H nitroreductase [Kiritimatiellaeota bacterium]|nr:NAD(P)H nitroreductase [Kiritimatiellota bacterium]
MGNSSSNRDVERFLELLRHRASCRSYLDREVEDWKLDNCLEAARLAPSACNKQPWRFKIVKDLDLRARICADGLLPGLPMPWLAEAPVIVVVCSEENIVTHTLAPLVSGVKYQLLDLGIAGEHFVLAATVQGLATCWIGWFKEKRVREILRLPRRLKIVSLISLGYPAAPLEQPAKKEISEILVD